MAFHVVQGVAEGSLSLFDVGSNGFSNRVLFMVFSSFCVLSFVRMIKLPSFPPVKDSIGELA